MQWAVDSWEATLAIVWDGWNLIQSGIRVVSPRERPTLAVIFCPLGMPNALRFGLEVTEDQLSISLGLMSCPEIILASSQGTFRM